MKKKRFSKVLFLLPVIIVALLLSSFTTVALAAEATADDIPLLRVENELAQAGETVVIEVKTENNPGILNALLTLTFDEELTLIDIQEGDALSKLDFTPPGKNSEGTYYSPCNFLWDTIDDADSTNGTILKLTFLLPEDADPGTIYDIELSYVYGDIADGNLDSIEFDIINGYVEVLDYTPGDVNGDGRFNGTDITLLRRYITGGYGVSIDTRAADVNDDGRINGTDVTLIRRFIAGGYGVELKPSHGCFEHNLVKVDAVPATCTVDGHFAYWQCSSCNKLYADAESKNQIFTSDIVDEANGHTEVVDSAVTPTCTATGLTEGKHCSICEKVIIAQETVVANGHTDVIDSAVAPTCTTTGLTEGKHCSVCEKVIIAQETVVANGHTEVIDSAVAPTCTTTGLTEGKHCSVCQVVIIAQQTTDKLVHSMSKIEAKDADCTEDGNIAYWTCTRCNKVYSDANGNTEITLNSTIIVAKGHTFADIWDYDAFDHWHPSTCGHTDQVYDKVNHNILSNGHCSANCGYIHYIQLDAPVIEKVEYDVVRWEPVDNAAQYKVFVNGDFYATTDGDNTSLALKNVKNQLGEYLSVANYVSIRVQALGSGRYMDSQKSSEKQYYYVSETQSSDADLLEGYKIGFGYNLIEDEYLNPADKASGTSVLNINKLFTVGKFTPVNNSTGVGVAYSYSSIDEFVSHSTSSLGFNGGVKVAPIGSLKLDLSTNSSTDYRSYKYVETFVFYGGLTYKNLEFTNLDDEELRHCLGDEFVKDIKRESVRTANMSDEQLLDYIYSNYGTHAILGVVTGGSYVVRYTIMTNEESIAQKAKAAFTIAAEKNDLKSILNINFGLTAAELSEEELKISDTKSQINFMYRGSTGGMCSDSDEVSSAVNEWSGNISSDNDVAVMFTNNGAIALSTLIGFVDTGLGNAYEAYINERADDLYHELYDKYTKPATLPVTVDENNVLYIDLSAYQNGGSLGDAYHANLFEGVFTVYPKMMGKRIDKIVIKGAFDQYNENLIDGFSIKLADTWNSDVTIVVDNLGVIAASEHGFVYTLSYPAKYNVTMEYTGVNAIQTFDGKVQFHSSVNGQKYDFAFVVNADETINYTTIQIGATIRLPEVTKVGYTFNGWKDGNGNDVTDEFGYYLSSYTPSTSIVTLYADMVLSSFKVTLDYQGAETEPAMKEFYIVVNDGPYSDFAGDTSIMDKPQPVIPIKDGYVFGGYYLVVSNNSTASATGTGMYIDENGVVTSYAISNDIKGNITVKALWIPAKITVTLNNSGADKAGTTKYYTRYQTGVYSDDKCNTSIAQITIPTKTGWSFAGYYTAQNGGGTQVIDVNGNIDVTASKGYKKDITLYAYWTINEYVIRLNNNKATFPGTANIYTKYGVGTYSDNGRTNTLNKITVPIRTGYTFGGYYLDGTQYIDNNGNILNNCKTITKNIDLTAKWTNNTYTVVYDGNGHTSGSTNQSNHTYDVGSKLTTNGFAKTYWKFTGWNTEEDGSGTSYANNATVFTLVDKGTITLYAQWEQCEYVVTFNTNGGTAVNQAIIAYGSPVVFSNYTTTRAGYTFDGWYQDPSFSTKYNDNYANSSNSDLVAYAKWTAIPYNCSIVFTGDFNTNCTPMLLITRNDGTKTSVMLKPHVESVFVGVGDMMNPIYEDRVVASFNYTHFYGETVEILAFNYTYTEFEEIYGMMSGTVTYESTCKCEYQKYTISGDTSIDVVFTKTRTIISAPWMP